MGGGVNLLLFIRIKLILGGFKLSNYIYITLDTTPAANPSLSIAGGSTYASAQLVDLAIGTTDSDTTGYQMKLWGSVDLAYDSNVQDTEQTSSWITYNNSKQIKLSNENGTKDVYLKIRDDVHNESSQVSDSIILDNSIPVVTVTNPDVSKISKVNGKNIASFSFSVNEIFTEYKVKVVSSSGASESTGALIPTTNGSTNTSGNGQDFNTSTSPITVTITGKDLEIASSGDGEKVIKVFVKDKSGLWSS
jgi:hypothetical protein